MYANVRTFQRTHSPPVWRICVRWNVRTLYVSWDTWGDVGSWSLARTAGTANSYETLALVSESTLCIVLPALHANGMKRKLMCCCITKGG